MNPKSLNLPRWPSDKNESFKLEGFNNDWASMSKEVTFFLANRDDICIVTLMGMIQDIPDPPLESLQNQIIELSPKWILLNFAGVDDIRYEILEKVPTFLQNLAAKSLALKICSPRSNVHEKLVRGKLVPNQLFANSIDEAIRSLSFKCVSYQR